jgi:hypothetical protein
VTGIFEQFVDWVPAVNKVTVQVDGGFGQSELYERCALLGIDYVIRF